MFLRNHIVVRACYSWIEQRKRTEFVRALTFPALVLWCLTVAPVRAIESTAAAGPVGGTDIRSAILPPPGFYAGSIQGYAETLDFLDGSGRRIPNLTDASLGKTGVAPFAYAATGPSLFDGAFGFGAILPIYNTCGRLFTGTRSRCNVGPGDLYAELDWGRFFGVLRPSKDPGAYPIAEGLALLVGFGALFPTGRFSNSDPLGQALSPGSHVWDFAPSLALTYTSPPLIGEGTEITGKFFANNYLTNPVTHYHTGTLLDLDFAVSEHLGRVQAGLAGSYAVQVRDDTLHEVSVAPDGRRFEALTVGPVLSYDLPEYAASLKIKALRSVFTVNAPTSYLVITSWVQRF